MQEADPPARSLSRLVPSSKPPEVCRTRRRSAVALGPGRHRGMADSIPTRTSLHSLGTGCNDRSGNQGRIALDRQSGIGTDNDLVDEDRLVTEADSKGPPGPQTVTFAPTWTVQSSTTTPSSSRVARRPLSHQTPCPSKRPLSATRARGAHCRRAARSSSFSA
jgi:hypothetical protein